jgi:hypothetical protein
VPEEDAIRQDIQRTREQLGSRQSSQPLLGARRGARRRSSLPAVDPSHGRENRPLYLALDTWLSGYGVMIREHPSPERLPALSWAGYRHSMSLTADWTDHAHSGWASPTCLS